MHRGYLLVETHAMHPGLVRIREAEAAPADRVGNGGPRVRYVARFDDLDAARMHAHERLRRGLVDVDAGLYRSDPLTAVAAVAAVDLSHREVYVDPALADDPALAATIAAHRARQQRVGTTWRLVGAAAVLLLVLKLLLGF